MLGEKKTRKNVYTHEIDLTPLKIKNQKREKIRIKLEKIKYRGYEVEQISDGRKIIITKPGGKFVFGPIKRDDFMVWIYDPSNLSLWLISHKNIYHDLEEKGKINPLQTIKIINALEKVYNGKDPEDVLKAVNLNNPIGELPEVLLKVYKWIWGQEDCNYPSGKGRAMSWEGWSKKSGIWKKTGEGIGDLRNKLQSKKRLPEKSSKA